MRIAERHLPKLLRVAHLSDWNEVVISSELPEHPDNGNELRGDTFTRTANIRIDGPHAQDEDGVIDAVTLALAALTLIPFTILFASLGEDGDGGPDAPAVLVGASFWTAHEEVSSRIASQLRTAFHYYQGAVPGTALTS